MSQRFFVEPPIELASIRFLVDQEAHHLGRVMRAKVGDSVTLFDGTGCEFQAEVTTIKRSRVELLIKQRLEIDRELDVELILGAALPKGDRQRWLVEKAVELGVTRLVPLETQRGVAQPTESARMRLARTVIEASKQCGRNRLMSVEKSVSIKSWIKSCQPKINPRDCWLAHPGGEPLGIHSSGEETQTPPRESCVLAVGPEGGFVEQEVDVARDAGWRIVGLGPRILRIETAAILLVATALR